MKERSLDFIGFPNYKVTTNGEVFRVYSTFSKLLQLKKRRCGYVYVTLYSNGLYKSVDIQRLVAIAFISNPNNYTQVNHINENKLDNRVENLEWCDAKYNNNYGTRNKRISEKLYKPIEQYSTDGILIKTHKSTLDAAKEFNCSTSNIRAVLKGKSKTACGFIFKYKE